MTGHSINDQQTIETQTNISTSYNVHALHTIVTVVSFSVFCIATSVIPCYNEYRNESVILITIADLTSRNIVTNLSVVTWPQNILGGGLESG